MSSALQPDVGVPERDDHRAEDVEQLARLGVLGDLGSVLVTDSGPVDVLAGGGVVVLRERRPEHVERPDRVCGAGVPVIIAGRLGLRLGRTVRRYGGDREEIDVGGGADHVRGGPATSAREQGLLSDAVLAVLQ
jgi:hypothetical protein